MTAPDSGLGCCCFWCGFALDRIVSRTDVLRCDLGVGRRVSQAIGAVARALPPTAIQLEQPDTTPVIPYGVGIPGAFGHHYGIPDVFGDAVLIKHVLDDVVIAT